MKNLVVIYDDLDTNNGKYFKASQEHLSHKLSGLEDLTVQRLNTEQCLANPIDHYTIALAEQPFVFVSYAHGNENAIYIDQNAFIHLGNAYFFAGTIFYACGCLSAKELGQRLIAENCRVFLGYNAKISSANPESEPVFQECENAFLANFLTTTDTIQECLTFMNTKYNEMIVHLNNEYGIFAASILQGNLRAFEILCKEDDNNLSKLDFL